jgi:hypothetical protein
MACGAIYFGIFLAFDIAQPFLGTSENIRELSRYE